MARMTLLSICFGFVKAATQVKFKAMGRIPLPIIWQLHCQPMEDRKQ
jgi:hypothetical protein